MEAARSIELSLRVMSCNGLSSTFNFFQNLSVYAKVSIVNEEEEGIKQRYQLQNTPIDWEGNGDPEWNHDMHFDLKQIWNSTTIKKDNLFLEFDLLSEGLPVLGDNTIGNVYVHMKELVTQEEEFNGGGVTRFVSYQVKSPDGKRDGVLNFSYKVLVITAAGGLQTKFATQFPPAAAYPPPPLPPRPSPSNLYPKIDISEPPPPIYCPPPVYSPPPEIYHHLHHHNQPPPPEVFYHLAPPLDNMGHHMPQDPVYPDGYGYGVGPVVRGHTPYPTIEVPSAGYGSSISNTGREQHRDISGGSSSGGYWRFRYKY